MARQYSIPFSITPVTAAQTLVQIMTSSTAAGPGIEVVEINVGGLSNTSNAGVLQFNRMSVAATGGTAAVVNPLNQGDTASTLKLLAAQTMVNSANVGTVPAGGTLLSVTFNAQAGGNWFWARGFGNSTQLSLQQGGATTTGIAALQTFTALTSCQLVGYIIVEERT